MYVWLHKKKLTLPELLLFKNLIKFYTDIYVKLVYKYKIHADFIPSRKKVKCGPVCLLLPSTPNIQNNALYQLALKCLLNKWHFVFCDFHHQLKQKTPNTDVLLMQNNIYGLFIWWFSSLLIWIYYQIKILFGLVLLFKVQMIPMRPSSQKRPSSANRPANKPCYLRAGGAQHDVSRNYSILPWPEFKNHNWSLEITLTYLQPWRYCFRRLKSLTLQGR